MNIGFTIILEDEHDTTKGLKVLEKEYIEHIYKRCKYNQSRAAKALGLSRGTLRSKLKYYFDDEYI